MSSSNSGPPYYYKNMTNKGQRVPCKNQSKPCNGSANSSSQPVTPLPSPSYTGQRNATVQHAMNYYSQVENASSPKESFNNLFAKAASGGSRKKSRRSKTMHSKTRHSKKRSSGKRRNRTSRR